MSVRNMLRVGQPVTWNATLGGGGGSGRRANRKSPRDAVVVAIGPCAVRIQVLDRPASFAPVWVRRANVVPRRAA